MSVLGFFLGLALTAAALSAATSLLVAAACRVVGVLRLSSARRADVALLGGLLPGVVGVVGASLAGLPAFLAIAGLGADHCLQHDHHWHLCPAHLAGLPPWMALCGAAAAAFVVGRAVVVIVERHQQQQLLRAVVDMGARSTLDDGSVVVTVDGPPTLLHAADGFVIASRSLLELLSVSSRQASLQHEAAHLRRGDSRWLFVLSLAASLAPPLFGTWMARVYRQAAEEAADEEAAAVVGVVDVAAAVIDVSRLRQRSVLECLPAVDGADLERRVLRLLSLTPRPRRSGAVVVVVALAAGVLAVTPFFNDVHHLAESALAHVESARHQHGT